MDRKISGKNATGELRNYTFHLLNARDGTKIFHETISTVMRLIPAIKKHSESTGDLTIMDMLGILPNIVTWEKALDLSRQITAGGKVEIDDTEHNLDSEGFCDAMQGDPLEFYACLAWGIYANYQKYIDDFFLDRGEQDGVASTPALSKAQTPAQK